MMENGYGLRSFSALSLRDSEFRIMLIVASTLWLYSCLLKFPFMVPSNYSDVGYLWIRDVYQGHHNLEIPYYQYPLEYPQVIGALVLAAQAISTWFPIIFDQYNTFVVVMAILEYPFMIGTLFNLYKLCGKLNMSHNRIFLYILTTLSFVIYGFYNWDFVVAYFTTLSIGLYLDHRFDLSSVALTLGVLTKFIPGIMFFAMLAGLPNNRARVRFAMIAGVLWGAVNLPFAVANFNVWVQLFIGYSGPNHQLQNTWISWVISLAGLGDIISGARAGQILSISIFIYLVARALLSKRTPLEKILLSWYAWYGAIYLFDPQMFIQLFPIVVLTPNFNFIIYRLADMLNGFIILFYFLGSSHPGLPKYVTDQLTPFGLINMSAALRQLIFLAAYFAAFNPKLQGRLRQVTSSLPLRRLASSLTRPLQSD